MKPSQMQTGTYTTEDLSKVVPTTCHSGTTTLIDTPPSSKTYKSLPQKPLTCDHHLLPQLRVSAFRNRRSLEENYMGSIASHHPLIREWHHKRMKSANLSSTSSSQLTRHKHNHSELSIGQSDSTTYAYSEGEVETVDFPTKKQKEKLQSNTEEMAAAVCNDKKPLISTTGKRSIRLPAKGNGNTRQYSQHQCKSSLPRITTSNHLTTTDVIEVEEHVRRHTVHFVDETKDGKLIPDPVPTSHDICTLSPRPVSTPTNTRGNLSGAQAYNPFSHTESSGDCESSVSSLASLTDNRNSRKGRDNVTSLPSLPLLHNSNSDGLPQASSSSVSCLHSRLSERDCISSQVKKKKKEGEKRCSIVNLRIPFGKIEEWDVPQQVGHRDKNCRSPGDGENVVLRTGDDLVVDITAQNTSKPRRLEFIVFNDLPEQPLPSTSMLMASLMKPAPSPHHSHHHASHPLHWHHLNPQSHTDHAHSHCSKEYVHKTPIAASTSPNRSHDSNGLIMNASTMYENTNVQAHNTDSIMHTNVGIPNPSTNSNSTSLNMCTAFATNSGTNLHVPCVSSTSFISHCFPPHALRYHHPTMRHTSLPPRMANHTPSTDCNHSMCITSYPNHTRPTTGAHTTSITIGSSGDRRVINMRRAGTYPSAGDMSISSDKRADLNYRSVHASIKHSRVIQLMRQSTRGTGRECGHNCSTRPVKKNNSHDNGFAYPDPRSDCSSRYHHRLLRLAALVTETLTYEHTKRRQRKTSAHSQ